MCAIFVPSPCRRDDVAHLHGVRLGVASAPEARRPHREEVGVANHHPLGLLLSEHLRKRLEGRLEHRPVVPEAGRRVLHLFLSRAIVKIQKIQGRAGGGDITRRYNQPSPLARLGVQHYCSASMVKKKQQLVSGFPANFYLPAEHFIVVRRGRLKVVWHYTAAVVYSRLRACAEPTNCTAGGMSRNSG